MRRVFLMIVATGMLLLMGLSCQQKVKADDAVAPDVKELSPEEEAKIQLIINFDGKWQRGARAIIVINGKRGRIVARNGATIPITVRYLSERKVRIIEEEYNVDYLANWLPRRVAQQLVQTRALRAHSILEIIDENTLRGTVYGWNVIHKDEVVQDIQPYVSREEWKRIP